MRKIIVVLVLFCLANAGVYEQNCVKCHKKLEVGIDKFFYRYLLVYSSEKDLKKALENYLLHPSKQTSLFSEDLVLRFGIKKKTKLSKKELKKALDAYWEKYKLFGKLK